MHAAARGLAAAWELAAGRSVHILGTTTREQKKRQPDRYTAKRQLASSSAEHRAPRPLFFLPPPFFFRIANWKTCASGFDVLRTIRRGDARSLQPPCCLPYTNPPPPAKTARRNGRLSPSRTPASRSTACRRAASAPADATDLQLLARPANPVTPIAHCAQVRQSNLHPAVRAA
jgi:hypothetical protein